MSWMPILRTKDRQREGYCLLVRQLSILDLSDSSPTNRKGREMGWVLSVSYASVELEFVRAPDESSTEICHPGPTLHVPVGGHLKPHTPHFRMATLATQTKSRLQHRRFGHSWY